MRFYVSWTSSGVARNLSESHFEEAQRLGCSPVAIFLDRSLLAWFACGECSFDCGLKHADELAERRR